MKRRLYFVHEGKANYPSIKSNRELLCDRFDISEIRPADVERIANPDDAIFWYMMGFYRSRPRGLVIHDYRSLSIGKLARIKDLMKSLLNAKPDIRIVQRETIDRYFFIDRVTTLLQDVGVPDSVLKFKESTAEKNTDFFYFGVISDERKLGMVIDSFIRKFGSSSQFTLAGEVKDSIAERYTDHPNVVFTGKIAQHDIFDIINRSRIVVAYFPDHYPHTIQTPTKLLEAAALGAKVLANHQPMNERKRIQYDINVHWGASDDIFAALPDNLEWTDNSGVDPSPMLWSNIVKESGVFDTLNREMEKRGWNDKLA